MCIECRFGEKVGGVTEETLAVAGHAMATAYNLYKVISPASIGVNYLGKSLGKGVRVEL